MQIIGTLTEKALGFFRREFESEEESAFARLKRVPDTQVAANLRYYESLDRTDRAAFSDCCSHLAYASYAFVFGGPKLDHTLHPFFDRWRTDSALAIPERSVPVLRAMVQQYKIDGHRGVRSSVTDEEFRYASSVRSVKAPELRKRVRAALKPFGHYKTDELGYYRCQWAGREFAVGVDYGGRTAQLRYVVVRPEFDNVHPLSQFRFERVLGVGNGNWNFIVEENVEDALSVFGDLVKYCYELPDRMRTALK